MTEHNAPQAPALRDALVGLACVVVADALLIAQAFVLLRLEVSRAVLLTLFPVFLAGTFRCFSAKPQGSSR